MTKDDPFTSAGLKLLRDYFAGQALQGLLAAPNFRFESESALCKAAYTIADDMLAERGK